MKKIILIALTGALASLAIAYDGITYQPFIEGIRTGEPAWTEDFIGRTYQDGDEVAFAGFALQKITPVTGP